MNAHAIEVARLHVCTASASPLGPYAHHYVLRCTQGGDEGECIGCGFERFWPTIEYDDTDEDATAIYGEPVALALV